MPVHKLLLRAGFVLSIAVILVAISSSSALAQDGDDEETKTLELLLFYPDNGSITLRFNDLQEVGEVDISTLRFFQPGFDEDQEIEILLGELPGLPLDLLTKFDTGDCLQLYVSTPNRQIARCTDSSTVYIPLRSPRDVFWGQQNTFFFVYRGEQDYLENCSTTVMGSTQCPVDWPLGISGNEIMLHAESGVESNEEWLDFQLTDTFDSIPMVLVPAGCFTYGSTDADPEARTDEQPADELCFESPFWIDQYEVTNADFNRLDGDARLPGVNINALLPRDSITWQEAQAFCRERGGRLPTEIEWEYAARGPENWRYPWGDTFIQGNAVYDGSPMQAVDSLPEGASWVGAYHMSGNAREWTLSLYLDYPYDADDGREDVEAAGDRVIRGGSRMNPKEFLRSANRVFSEPDDVDGNTGFRCYRAYESAE